MSDESFDELYERSLQADDLGDKPDINDYIYDYDPEFLEVWELMPSDMTEGQIEAMIDTLLANDFDEMSWAEILGEMEADFWEWFNDNYGGG